MHPTTVLRHPRRPRCHQHSLAGGVATAISTVISLRPIVPVAHRCLTVIARKCLIILGLCTVTRSTTLMSPTGRCRLMELWPNNTPSEVVQKLHQTVEERHQTDDMADHARPP
ncbi:Hypothetical predicted protein [Olea europaea subsp. europaea]|uniref:Uncharacterized protein n=1 Tax=Olea europaea subsp. europaea TaxID=158383 RepID=A0A8S0T7N9_OLEEU|nr:Hypothetical predicted protein [Olea europaea subsp. europaea]